MLLFLCLGTVVTVATTAQWADLVKAALATHVETGGAAVSGAKLRALVTAAADRVNLQVPEAIGRLKFKDQVAQLAGEGQLALRLRTGQDFLVAPIGKEELLLDSPEPRNRSRPGIRQDLFEAFSRVDERIPWYIKDQDSIEWRGAGDTAPPNSVPVPRASIDLLVQFRRDFASGQAQPVSSNLTNALATARPLAEFSRVVRESSLQPSWHEFRSKAMADRISTWASENGLPWNAAWITSESSGTEESSIDSESTNREWRNSLRHLLGQLDREDLARISVPMDIVLRLMTKVR